MTGNLLHGIDEKVDDQPLRITQHSLPSFRQRAANAPIALDLPELSLRLSDRGPTGRCLAAQESVQGSSRLRWRQPEEIHVEEPALLPSTSGFAGQIEPPNKAVGKDSEIGTLVKGVAEELFLVFREISPGTLHLNQHACATVEPEAVVHSPISNGVLAGDLARIERVPAQRADDRIHRHLTCRLLAALRDRVNRRQPRDQHFKSRQVRHGGESTAYAPLSGRTPLDQRLGRRSRTISVRMPLAELGWKKEAVMSSIGSPKSM